MEGIQQLAIPLKQSQIDAAKKFWAGGWESKEFEQLRTAFPNPLDAVRINREPAKCSESCTRSHGTTAN
jgi:hypothetical protein